MIQSKWPYVNITNHNLVLGESIIYSNNGNTSIVGLTDGTTYHAIIINKDNIKLASSESNANNYIYIDFTTASTGEHILKQHNFSINNMSVSVI